MDGVERVEECPAHSGRMPGAVRLDGRWVRGVVRVAVGSARPGCASSAIEFHGVCPACGPWTAIAVFTLCAPDDAFVERMAFPFHVWLQPVPPSVMDAMFTVCGDAGRSGWAWIDPNPDADCAPAVRAHPDGNRN